MLHPAKLPHNTTIFSKMTALANQQGAINLAQGFPNFLSSEKLMELVNGYMHKGMNQYAPMAGVMALRERISEKYEGIYGVKYDVETEITVTAGGTQAIYTAIAALVHAGDEVILFEPAYDCYAPAVVLHGGIVVPVTLKSPDFKIDWETVKQKITSRTRLIMINTPHNPSGTVLNADDLHYLEKLTEGTDIIIISDEVYEHIIFDGQQHESILRYPNLVERSLVIYSFGKTYHNTGWKLGYVLAPEKLMQEFRSIHQYLVFSVNTPMQYALADFMEDKSEYESIYSFYQQKRDLFLQALNKSRFTFTPASGTYFQLLDYSKINDKKDMEFADELTIKFKVASIPLSPFYSTPTDHKVLRFCFAKTDETIIKAAEILCGI